MTSMGGGPNPPVRLDPWQNIVNVHWGKARYFGVLTIGVQNRYYNVATGPWYTVYQKTYWNSIALPGITGGQYYGYYKIGVDEFPIAPYSTGESPLFRIPAATPPTDWSPAVPEPGVAPRHIVQTIRDSVGVLNTFAPPPPYYGGEEYIPHTQIYIFNLEAMAEYGEEVRVDFSFHTFAWSEEANVALPAGVSFNVPLKFEIWRMVEGLIVPPTVYHSGRYPPPFVGADEGDKMIFGPILSSSTGSMPSTTTWRSPGNRHLIIRPLDLTGSFQ